MKKRILTIILMIMLMVTCVICVAIPSAAITSTATLPEAKEGEVIDVWLIAGQSNAIGDGIVDEYPSDEAYSSDKTLLTTGSENVWYIKNAETSFAPTGFGQASTGKSGPEIGIATALNSSTNKNAIIKVAYGNTALYDNTTSSPSVTHGTWTPPSYIEKYNLNTLGNRTGDLYLTFIAKVQAGLEELIAAGYTPNLKGIWWMQGEADTLVDGTTIERYEELLRTLISDMRNDLSDVSGYNCSELPFVYGRILANHPAVGMEYPVALTRVQTAQDNVAADNSLKNVFMINTSTDLVDPVTGEHRLPVQQDQWHYDALSQQMIGEKFVSIVNANETRTLTKYGYLPTTISSNSFAVFVRNENESYVFSNSYNSWKSAFEASVKLTNGSSTAYDEAVVLMLNDSVETGIPSNASQICGTVSLDLNGKKLEVQGSFFNTQLVKNNGPIATVNVFNGTLRTMKHGLVYGAVGTTYESGGQEKTININFTDVVIGFAEYSGGTNSKLLANAYSGSGTLNAVINMNFESCTLDFVNNAPDSATLGEAKTKTADSKETSTMDYHLMFLDCEFLLQSASQLKLSTMSATGDSVTFVKGENGKFGQVQISGTTTTGTFVGVDDGYDVELSLKGADGVYYLAANADVETPYGTIPKAYSDSSAYPYAIFKKIDGVYTFDSAKTKSGDAFTQGIKLLHVSTGTTDDVVIFVRESIGADRSFPSNVCDIKGTLTLDLNGHTITPSVTLFRTDFDDDGVVDGVQSKTTVNIKNGGIVVSEYGVIYGTVYANYTVPKTLDVNIDNVMFSFLAGTEAQTASYKFMDLLVSDRSRTGNPASTTEAYINVKATNCTFDLVTNARSEAVIGTLECGTKDQDTNDYNIEIIGGTVITDNIPKMNCGMKGTGDTLTFKKNSDGEYTRILMRQNLAEPDGTNYRNGENGKTVTLVETDEKVGIYKVYELSEDYMTKYGRIPMATAGVNPFALFIKNNDGSYSLYNMYGTYPNVMNAAIDLTKISLASPASEVVILLIRDYEGTSFPSNLSSIATTVTVDLNGYSLGAFESLGNTSTGGAASNGTINFINGKILLKRHPGLYIASGTTYNVDSSKTLNVNFENVYIGFAAGANAPALLGRIASTTAAIADFNLKYSNCTIDMVTNRSSNSSLMLGKWSPDSGTDRSKVTVDFINCNFIGLNESDFVARTTAGQDVIRYSKTDNNHYATLTLPKDATAPTGTYSIGNGNAKFVKISETETTIVYALTPVEVSSITFTPKTSITLGSELVYNVYVPVSDILKSFTVDGKTYANAKIVTLDDGNQYYHIAVPMVASEAARNVVLKATITVDGKDYNGTWTMSIPKYSKKVIVSDANSTEKTLVKDVLAYIKAAYIYFDADNKTEVVNVIDEILGDYNNTFAKVEGNTDADDGLYGVVIVLEEKPAIRFILPAGATADNYTFKSGNTTLKYTVGTTTVDEKTYYYAEVSLYAYQLINEITYTNGTESGCYHINSYYDFVTTDSELENDANLINLVEKLYNYCKSAEAYRASVTNK